MNKPKRALTLGSALVAIALMAACTAPIPENGAMPTVTPQEEGAQNPDSPPADAPRESSTQRDVVGDPSRQRGGGFMMDASAINDPDKPATNPAFSGTIVSLVGDKLTVSALSGAQEQSGRDTRQMEEKTLTLAEGFRVNKAEFERPNGNDNAGGNNGGQRGPGEMKIAEITKDEIAKDDRVTVWTDENGNAVYAIVMSGMGGNRRGTPPGDRQPGSPDGPQQRRE